MAPFQYETELKAAISWYRPNARRSIALKIAGALFSLLESAVSCQPILQRRSGCSGGGGGGGCFGDGDGDGDRVGVAVVVAVVEPLFPPLRVASKPFLSGI